MDKYQFCRILTRLSTMLSTAVDNRLERPRMSGASTVRAPERVASDTSHTARPTELVLDLQHFSVKEPAVTRRRVGGRRCVVRWMARVASDILSGSFEAPGVLAEEFHEAYVSAESSQKGKDARFSQAHEHGRWAQGNRRPASPRSAPASRLILAKE